MIHLNKQSLFLVAATISSNPDTLIIVLGVESEAKTANESLSQNSNSLNSVISSLSNSGISEDDIQTSNFQFIPYTIA